MAVGLKDLKCTRAAEGPLDVDHRRLAERGGDIEVVSERGLDYLPLDRAVERHVDLLPLVVLSQVDKRVLFGELAKRDSQPIPVAGITRHDSGLQSRGRELKASVVLCLPDSIPDLGLGKTPEHANLAGADSLPLDCRPSLEDSNRGHLVVEAGSEPEPIAHMHGSGEHADVGDLLRSAAAFDLEDTAGQGSVSVTIRGRQELRDTCYQPRDARSSDRLAEEDGIHLTAPRLLREFRAELVIRNPRLVLHVRGQQSVVVLSQQLSQASFELSVVRS